MIVGLLTGAAPGPARADCVQSGTTVTCSGPSPGGFNAGAQNALTVNVAPGAAVGTGLVVNNNNQVSNFGGIAVGDSGVGISAGSGNAIISGGSITAGINGTGIQSGSGPITNATGGTITVGDVGVGIYQSAAGANIVNNGSIRAGVGGVGILTNGGGASITNAGTILSGGCGYGIASGGAGNTVTNSGTIRDTGCGGTGIVSDNSNTVVNSGSIFVSGTGIGIQGASSSTIINSGTISTGTGGIGLYANSGSTLTNSGTIIVGSGFAFGGGMVGDGGGIQLTNTGTIIGGFGTPAMIVRARNNVLTNSGTITVGNFGGGMIGLSGNNTYINSGTINVGNTGIGIDSQGNLSSVTNSGAINGGDNSFGIQVRSGSTVANSGAITVGTNGIAISGNAGTTVTNSGAITAGLNGVGIRSGGNIFNSGSIVVGDSISFGTAGMLGAGTGLQMVNTGTITGGTGTPAMIVGGSNNTLTNAGTINVGTSGGGLIGTGSNTYINSGTINTGSLGIGISAQGTNATSINSGTINIGVGGTGIQTGNSHLVLNSGAINVASAGIGISSGAATSIQSSGTITVGTAGTGIAASGNSAVVANSGTITTCGVGISASGAGSSVSNSGTITTNGCGSTGILLGQGNSLANTGSIIAPVTLAMAPGGGTVNVTNSGTLNGAVALYGSGGNTLTNSGLITVTGQLNPGGGVTHVVDGTYTQTGSGVFNTRMSTNNAPNNYDTLRVLNSVAGTGVANLGGTVNVVLQPGLYGLSTTYPGVFTFSSSTGSFNAISEPYLFLNASAVYNPTSVDIVVTRTPFPQIPGGGTNAQAVGNVLEANYSPFLTGSLANFYMQLLQSTAPNTLSQLTGEVATAPQNASFTVFGQFLGTIFGQTGSVRALGGGTGGGTAAAQAPANSQSARVALADACVGESCDTDGQPAARRYTAWAQGFGGSGSIDGNTTVGSSRVDMSTGGGALGMDIRLERDALVGITLGTTAAGYTLTDIMSSGGARSIVFGLYGGYTAGPAYIDGALAYAYNTYTSNRFIGTGSISEIENASFNASQYGGRVESGWRFGFDRNVLTPFAGLTVQALSIPGYTETSRNATTGGPGMLGVSVQAQTTTSVRSTLGAQFETAITANDDAVFRPRVRLGWAHEYNTNRSATVTLSTVLPNAPFLVTGAQENADSLVVGAGFELELHRMVRLYGQFDGDFASNARAFAGTGGLRLVW